MNTTVFGPSGGTGGHIIALATQRGHHVRAGLLGSAGHPAPR